MPAWVYGLAALLENRKRVAKIAAGAAALLLLPALFVLLLPPAIFGGLTDAYDSENPGVPILSDGAAVVRNIDKANVALNGIMLESLDDLFAEIDKDFADSGGDTKIITNPYEGSNIIDSNLIICQYSAGNAVDFTSVSLADLERIVRENRKEIFSYTKRSETVSRTAMNSDTGETVTTHELIVYYTVIYNGDEHFADAVFFLTDEQKALAKDYGNNLHLFLNDNFIAAGNATHSLLAELAASNSFLGNVENFGSPLDSNWRERVTSEFGYRTHPVTGAVRSGHTGIDIAHSLGTEIKAVRSGKVIYVRNSSIGYGFHLAVNHGNLITLYAHCSRILVNEGDVVAKGQTIALVGSTGRSTGPHLHFEVIEDGVPQNPRNHLP